MKCLKCGHSCLIFFCEGTFICLSFQKTVAVTESSTSGNVIRCTLKRPIISDSDKIFNLTQQWHILYAYGSVSAVPGGKYIL